MRRYLESVLTAAVIFLPASIAFAKEECDVRVGEYSGRVKAEWLIKTRQMRLLEDFAFKGPDCRLWPVPKGAILDGASIPRIFWSVIGGPFDGRYRDGSVVHDYYCKVRTVPSDDVHEMFYHALLANGVDSATAGLMYYAVSWFGPRWQILKRVASNEDYGTYAVLRRAEELNFPKRVVDQMATSVGQPSPNAFPFAKFGKHRPGIGADFYSSEWLFKDGISVKGPREIATAEAFAKSLERKWSQPFVKGSADDFRILSQGAVEPEPTQSDVERLKRWIDAAQPTLATLKATAPRQIP